MSDDMPPESLSPSRQPDKKNGCSTGIFCVLVAVAFVFLLAFAFILLVLRFLEGFQS